MNFSSEEKRSTLVILLLEIWQKYLKEYESLLLLTFVGDFYFRFSCLQMLKQKKKATHLFLCDNVQLKGWSFCMNTKKGHTKCFLTDTLLQIIHIAHILAELVVVALENEIFSTLHLFTDLQLSSCNNILKIIVLGLSLRSPLGNM